MKPKKGEVVFPVYNRKQVKRRCPTCGKCHTGICKGLNYKPPGSQKKPQPQGKGSGNFVEDRACHHCSKKGHLKKDSGRCTGNQCGQKGIRHCQPRGAWWYLWWYLWRQNPQHEWNSPKPKLSEQRKTMHMLRRWIPTLIWGPMYKTRVAAAATARVCRCFRLWGKYCTHWWAIFDGSVWSSNPREVRCSLHKALAAYDTTTARVLQVWCKKKQKQWRKRPMKNWSPRLVDNQSNHHYSNLFNSTSSGGDHRGHPRR